MRFILTKRRSKHKRKKFLYTSYVHQCTHYFSNHMLVNQLILLVSFHIFFTFSFFLFIAFPFVHPSQCMCTGIIINELDAIATLATNLERNRHERIDSEYRLKRIQLMTDRIELCFILSSNWISGALYLCSMPFFFSSISFSTQLNTRMPLQFIFAL